MAIPAMIRPFLASRDGEDLAGAAVAFRVEDRALEDALGDGGGRRASKIIKEGYDDDHCGGKWQGRHW